MRIVVVGASSDRRRLRDGLTGTPLRVVGEFDSLAEARRHAPQADAFLFAAPSDGSVSGPRPPAEPLTPRETEVLVLMADGLPNKAIAHRLGISDQTVKFHVASICGKLGARNRTSAVRIALAVGLLVM